MLKKLREIAFKTLVENLGVPVNMLSRIEGDQPIAIELVGGEEIFISLNEKSIQTFVEIPLRDRRVLSLKAAKLMELIMSDEQVFLNTTKDKLIMLSEWEVNVATVERQLADKLTLFNKAVHYIKS
ncbi:hypothetical protein [Vibrio sagamiensis]|uniref:Uncharacterized protein n=1 Tax=Vibrio sagamiensis NBRC 104589 TaxID=1219064 RepID=A0A511QBB7_9VIBR|nr:hypothetical protein [Vibrio sagamiensis]PNQ62372.1 hypothetical protein C1141_10730 [Vibrio agarivorans]GEM74594.1 hypothetical protein VSA01S_07060 [Vibrio sagamiensis NBRC 104589]